MEVAGLVIGAVALVGTLKDCVDLFSYISAARSFGKDAELLNTKLDVEKTLLLQWAERVRLLSGDNCDRRLDEPKTFQAVSRVLAGIRLLLSEGSTLQKRYGLAPAEEDGRTGAVAPILSGPRMQSFNQEFGALCLRFKEHQKHVPVTKQVRWVIRDKGKFEGLIMELSSFISKLNNLIPSQRDITVSMSIEDLEKVSGFEKLQLVGDASAASENQVSVLANQTQRAQKTILDALWHYTIDERMFSLAKAHFRTLEWALLPPGSDNECDNLSAWLQSGSGTYWLSGKAGSGKSTLMKHLLQNSRTRELLQIWAGEDPLYVCNFFFWGFGASEQKSQLGLMRALLYQILDAETSLIPKLLPNSWRELRSNKTDRWANPSPIEIKEAFQRLAALQPWIGKYFFLIDGLDEFEGNYMDGISFIQALAQHCNFKVLVSSRPIPACVQAFSGEAKLRLQDLTRGDIAAYTNDIIGSHPYMQMLSDSEPAMAGAILHDITEKASGVFLWVVLACRSLLEGFAAHDSIKELRKRVDELPPELEDLFQHMLNRIEPRYKEQAAKLLRICYQKTLTPMRAIIPALGLAMFDQHDLSLDKIPHSRALSQRETRAKCELLDGRLRSRCWGLLELKPPSQSGRVLPEQSCSCGCPNGTHVPVVDSSVEFIHRSLFEFLNLPGIWDLNSLAIEDTFFDDNTALACISFHNAEAKMMRGGPPAEKVQFMARDVAVAFQYIMPTQETANITQVLLRFEDLLCQPLLTGSGLRLRGTLPEPSKAIRSRRLEAASVNNQPHDQLQILIPMAIEAGMILFVESCRSSSLWKSLRRFQAFPLLYHATRRPYQWFLLGETGNPDPKVVKFLITTGSNPNEMFVNLAEERQTPWTDWLQSLRKSLSLEKFEETASTIEVFIRGGASLDVSCTSQEVPLVSWIGSVPVTGGMETAAYRRAEARRAQLLRLIAERPQANDRVGPQAENPLAKRPRLLDGDEEMGDKNTGQPDFKRKRKGA